MTFGFAESVQGQVDPSENQTQTRDLQGVISHSENRTDGASATSSPAAINQPLPLPENEYPRLRDLLVWALQQAPRMRAQQAQVEAAEGNRISARAGMLPNASAWLQYMPYRREQRIGAPATTSDKLYYNIAANQPLYYWGALRNGARIGALQLDNARRNATEEYRNLVQDIRGQYVQLIIRKASLERTELALSRAEKGLTVATEKQKLNAISVADFGAVQWTRDQLKMSLDRAKEDYRHAKVVFASLCGVPAVAEDDIPDAVAPITVPMDEIRALTNAFVADVAGHAPSLAILRDQIQVEKLNYRVAKVRLRPKADFIVGAITDEQRNLSSADPTSKYGVTDYYAGLQLNWNIFDGFAAKGAARSSLARRRDLERQYDQRVSDLANSAQDLLKQLEFSLQTLQLTDPNVPGSEQWVAQVQSDVEHGFRAPSEIDDAKLQLMDAKLAAYNARADTLSKTLALLSTIYEDPALTALDRKKS